MPAFPSQMNTGQLALAQTMLVDIAAKPDGSVTVRWGARPGHQPRVVSAAEVAQT